MDEPHVAASRPALRTFGAAPAAALLALVLAGFAVPAAADCYDVVGCSDRSDFARRFDYLASRTAGPNCQFLREMRYAILAQHGHCSDSDGAASGPGACRTVDPARAALSAIERRNIATLRRAEAAKGCGP